MYESALIYIYLVVFGLAAGGIVVSGYRLMTNRPASFQARPDSAIGAFFQALVLIFGGPLVLMRNAIRGRLVERRPIGSLVASTAIASLWCFFCGVFLVHLIQQLA